MEMSFVTIKARIAEDSNDDRRRSARLPVELEAKMRELGASGVEAKVLNISAMASWPSPKAASRSERGSG